MTRIWKSSDLWRRNEIIINEHVKIFRIIDLWSVTCPVYRNVSKEDLEIYGLILKICRIYNKVTPKKIQQEFGLPERLGKKLLDNLVEDYKILTRFQGKNEDIYEFDAIYKKSEFEDASKILQVPFITQFLISLNPLLIIPRHISRNSIESDLNFEPLINGLEQINQKIDGMEEKTIYNVPNHFLRIELDKGIKINGVSKAILQLNDSKMSIIHNNWELAQIPPGHPDHESIIEKLENVTIDEKAIRIFLANKYPEYDPLIESVRYDNRSQKLHININPFNHNKFGKIFKLFQDYTINTIELPLIEDWFIELPVIICFLDAKNELSIKLFDNILRALNHEDGIAEIQSEIPMMKQIQSTLKRVPNSRNIVLSNLDIENLTRSLCYENYNDWFHIINGKLQEKDIFE